MIKQSSFENEYFIVLKLQGDVLKLAQSLQEHLSSKYDLYPDDVYPEVHITLDRIDKNKLDRAVEIIESVIIKYTEIDILVKDFDCLSSEENNFLVLNVEENKKLIQFSNELHNKFAKEDITTIDNYSEWKFHISLASTVFTEEKKDFDKEFKELCFRYEGINTPRSCKADLLEIWRPTLDENTKCIKRFQL
ncbi:MAG: 2'-5' RNA ligase family protein [Halanaerobiales bacterium]|nr:2'-5' RNA ligase family protein [Halanaerobiales bacterium]